MLRIGITGGIGSGKTFVSKRLVTMGFPVFDCDAASKSLMNTDPEIKQQLVEWLGPECYQENELNRPFVAQKLFSDPHIKQQIEQLVHPKVALAFAQWAEEQNCPFVLVESAILYESGFDQFVDKVLLIDANVETRVKRIMQRDACSRDQAEQRIKAQMSNDEKRQKAHYVLENNPNNDVNAQLFKLVKMWYLLLD